MATITITGIKEVTRKLGKLKAGVKDFSPAFKDMNGQMIKKLKENFPAKGSLLDSTWPPRKRAYSWPILQKTGKMRDTWHKKILQTELTITNGMRYAKYHQFGTLFLPVRKIVTTSNVLTRIAQKSLSDYIKTLI